MKRITLKGYAIENGRIKLIRVPCIQNLQKIGGKWVKFQDSSCDTHIHFAKISPAYVNLLFANVFIVSYGNYHKETYVHSVRKQVSV